MMAGEATIHGIIGLALDLLFTRLLAQRRQIRASGDVIIEVLGPTLEIFDYETRGHCDRVAAYADLLAEQLALSDTERRWLRQGAFLHDIGKMAVPREIITQPDRLTDGEWAIMKTHPVVGAKMIAAAPELAPVVPIVRGHHERFDGRAYPDCLKGAEIPLLARLFSVVDTYDAIVSDRPYRAGRSH